MNGLIRSDGHAGHMMNGLIRLDGHAGHKIYERMRMIGSAVQIMDNRGELSGC